MEPGSGAWSVPASTTGVPVTNFNGYMLFVRGNRSIVVSNQFVTTSGAANLRIKGKINIGRLPPILIIYGIPYCLAVRVQGPGLPFKAKAIMPLTPLYPTPLIQGI
jgi:hypothetical protein